MVLLKLARARGTKAERALKIFRETPGLPTRVANRRPPFFSLSFFFFNEYESLKRSM